MIGGMKGKMSEMMLDPMYRSPRPSVLIPGDNATRTKTVRSNQDVVVSVPPILANPLFEDASKTSTADHIPGTSQMSSSVHPPTEFVTHNTYIPSCGTDGT